MIRATVCELPEDRAVFAAAWAALAEHVRARGSDLVVLPEMPFSPWFAVSPDFDPATWDAAVRDHETWLTQLPELGAATVVSSRPVTRGTRRLSEGFVWSQASGYRAVHDKRYLPDEIGYWEARWFEPGDGRFEVADAGVGRIGMLICTEQWSLGHAQRYGKDGAQVIVTPRVTGKPTVEKWLTGGRAAAIVAGAFGLSSNRTAGEGGGDFGGVGWIVSPDGDVLATTSREDPFATVDIDLAEADAAKATYPRYALD